MHSQLAKKAKQIFFIFLILFYFSEKAFADSPYVTDSAETMPLNHIYTALYASFFKSNIITSSQLPALEFDFVPLPNFEVDTFTTMVNNVNAARRFRDSIPNTTGFGDIDVELRYRFLQETERSPQAAFTPTITIPTGSRNQGLGNGRAWYILPIAVQKSFGDWKTYAEIGYGVNSSPSFKNYLFGGCVCEKILSTKLKLGAEIFTQGASTDVTRSFTLLNLGCTYDFTKDFGVLASVGHSILGENQWIAYLAVGWG